MAVTTVEKKAIGEGLVLQNLLEKEELHPC